MGIKSKCSDSITSQIACRCAGREDANFLDPCFGHTQAAFAIVHASQEIGRILESIFTQGFGADAIPPCAKRARTDYVSPVSVSIPGNGEHMPAPCLGAMEHIIEARGECFSEYPRIPYQQL